MEEVNYVGKTLTDEALKKLDEKTTLELCKIHWQIIVNILYSGIACYHLSFEDEADIQFSSILKFMALNKMVEFNILGSRVKIEQECFCCHYQNQSKLSKLKAKWCDACPLRGQWGGTKDTDCLDSGSYFMKFTRNINAYYDNGNERYRKEAIKNAKKIIEACDIALEALNKSK